jgi:hypothetical protein
MPIQTPTPLSMILCDAVVPDGATNKLTIFGAFDRVLAPAFPTRVPNVTVFAELTDGHGKTTITLKYCRVTSDSLDGELIKSVDIEVAFKDPREVVRLILYLSPIDFPDPGEYRIMLAVGDVIFAERRILAMPVPGTAS